MQEWITFLVILTVKNNLGNMMIAAYIENWYTVYSNHGIDS